MSPHYDDGADMPDFDDSRFDNIEQQQTVWDALEDYASGSGFSQEQWFDMVDNLYFEEWYDENGDYHFYFEFDSEYLGGSRSMSG